MTIEQGEDLRRQIRGLPLQLNVKHEVPGEPVQQAVQRHHGRIGVEKWREPGAHIRGQKLDRRQLLHDPISVTIAFETVVVAQYDYAIGG